MKFAAIFAMIFAVAIGVAVVQGGGGGEERDPGAGHGPPDIVSEPAGRSNGVEWQKFTVQGVTVLIPTDGGKNWDSNLNYDGCDPLRAQYFVIEHVPSGVRFRVDLQDSEIRFRGAPSAGVQKVADTIQRSLDGKFQGDPRLSGTPRPIPLDCGDRVQDDIPPVYRAWEPPPIPEETAIVEPSSTPAVEPSSTPSPLPSPIMDN